MINYFDALEQASFRGFPFPVERDEENLSRRTKSHLLQNKDIPYHEDLGGDVNNFPVEAVISGDDFVEKAEEFRKILLMPGTGKLILPHQGEINAIVKSARRVHQYNAVGFIRFSITFERSEDSTSNSVSPTQTIYELSDAKDNALLAFQSNFLASYINNAPDFVLNDILGQVDGFKNNLKTVLNTIERTVNFPQTQVSNAETIVDDFNGIFNDLNNLFNPSQSYSSAIAMDIDDVIAADSVSGIEGLVNIINNESQIVESSTLNTQAIRINNTQSVDLLTQGQTLANAVGLVQTADFSSRSEALSIRDNLYQKLENFRTQTGEKGWYESWKASNQLMTALNRDVNDKIGRLPQTINIQTNNNRSSLAMAHRLYGDNLTNIVSQADDIAKRNKAYHPGFLSSEPMEVLVNG